MIVSLLVSHAYKSGRCGVVGKKKTVCKVSTEETARHPAGVFRLKKLCHLRSPALLRTPDSGREADPVDHDEGFHAVCCTVLSVG